MCYPVVSQVLFGGCPKLRWHFKACQNPRVVLENTLWAKSCATTFSEPVTLLHHSALDCAYFSDDGDLSGRAGMSYSPMTLRRANEVALRPIGVLSDPKNLFDCIF